MSTIQEIRSGSSAQTVFGHIRELADRQHYNSAGLSFTIDKLEAEIDLLKVIQQVWLRAEFDTAHLVEETTKPQEGDAE